MKCKNCKAEIGKNVFCSNCGTQNVKKEISSFLYGILIGVLAVLLAGGILMLVLNNMKQKEPRLPETGVIEVFEEDEEEEREAYILEEDEEDEREAYNFEEDGYLRPGSDREYLTREELVIYTKTELAFIRNEIYARHGYIFKKSPYKEYFAGKSWYKPNKYFSESLLNKYEKANIALIKDFEEGNIARLDYSDTWNYIMPYSDDEYISKADLLGRSQDEVAFIRNEIYARKGYVFNKEPYKSYFNSKSWYVPDKNFSTAKFNKYEKANLVVIEDYEKSMGWK